MKTEQSKPKTATEVAKMIVNVFDEPSMIKWPAHQAAEAFRELQPRQQNIAQRMVVEKRNVFPFLFYEVPTGRFYIHFIHEHKGKLIGAI